MVGNPRVSVAMASVSRAGKAASCFCFPCSSGVVVFFGSGFVVFRGSSGVVVLFLCKRSEVFSLRTFGSFILNDCVHDSGNFVISNDCIDSEGSADVWCEAG